MRDRRFAKQIADGFFPPETKLPPRNNEPFGEVPAWDDLDAQDQALFARYQEVYAAMVDNVDQNLGRLLSTVDALGELDNTIVIFTSDNGGTGEGGLLSIAFPADYATSGRFFAYYTTPNEVRLSSFVHDAGNANHASASSETVLLSERPVTAAGTSRSYTLFAAVKLPVTGRFVIVRFAPL